MWPARHAVSSARPERLHIVRKGAMLALPLLVRNGCSGKYSQFASKAPRSPALLLLPGGRAAQSARGEQLEVLKAPP